MQPLPGLGLERDRHDERPAIFGFFGKTQPKQVVADFYKQDPKGNLDRIYARIIPNAPAIKQAEAKLLQARSNLDQAKLNLRYCDIVSDIDGVVTSRNINPGNYVQVGQNLMAVRSLTEIWIDANFKETQLADLRIGQRVRCEVDMYGSRREYQGRITGFTMGTGQTLALLPPQNATGNFVKIVQLQPRRADLVRRPVGRAVRLLQGTSRGAQCREVLAAVCALADRPNPAAAMIGRGHSSLVIRIRRRE